MKRINGIVIALMILFFADARVCRSDVREAHAATFVVEQDVVIAASPEVAFDAATGDISGWWDHHVSEKPKKLFIEAKPSGGERIRGAGPGGDRGTPGDRNSSCVAAVCARRFSAQTAIRVAEQISRPGHA